MKGFVLLIFALVLMFSSKAQNYYWIGFADKNHSAYSLDAPDDYLSERAIQRREKQNIPIDSLDLPVNSIYIDSILKVADVELVHASKWLNGITVKSRVDSVEIQFPELAFVREVQRTKPNRTLKSVSNKFGGESEFELTNIDTSYYGESVHQVGMMEGEFLHNSGYKGEGLHIAVLDAGFYKADELPAFDSLWANGQILGTRDFVNPNSDIFAENYHGMSVLSTMGGNMPGQLIGTAPHAKYWLLRSEDAPTEYIIEEDNWVVAAEFADSVGADIINSSLGYYEFDDPSANHTYADMDGHTTRVTRGANIAASKGMLVFTSAGNERRDPWFRIIAPSDGDKVIGVGAVDKDLQPASFTSAGPASDGDVKPNLAAMGVRSIAQLSSGSIGQINGTSFSSPILAGMAACLWQRYPNKTAVEIKVALQKSGDRYFSPDSLLGYGIPNMRTASVILDPLSVTTVDSNSNWQVYPNPFSDRINVITREPVIGDIVLEWLTMDGALVKRWNKSYSPKIELNDIPDLSRGMYFLRISSGELSETIKLSKQ
ncbi:S8 family serine peptidase [Maribellus sediminis]|uniref:S8 family serine peptidase n=1 Tax=Maribellus sediminis TaxID=2696285 RepID=UPI0014302C34|nr:S8 family serine peptidase [Maribellus sediminis]